MKRVLLLCAVLAGCAEDECQGRGCAAENPVHLGSTFYEARKNARVLPGRWVRWPDGTVSQLKGTHNNWGVPQ